MISVDTRYTGSIRNATGGAAGIWFLSLVKRLFTGELLFVRRIRDVDRDN